MSGIATMRAMIELGLSDEEKLALLAAMEADAGPARSTSAERQRRYRQRKRGGDVTGDVTALRNESDVTAPPYEEDTSTPPPSKAKALSGGKRKRACPPFELPDWVPAEPWAAFETMRKAMPKVPFTDDAKRGIVRELEELRGKGHDPEKLLLKAVKKGWRSLFGDDDTLTRKPNGAHAFKPQTEADLRRGIAFAEDNGDPERAAELRAELAAMKAGSADPKIAQLVRQVSSDLRVSGARRGASP